MHGRAACKAVQLIKGVCHTCHGRPQYGASTWAFTWDFELQIGHHSGMWWYMSHNHPCLWRTRDVTAVPLDCCKLRRGKDSVASWTRC